MSNPFIAEIRIVGFNFAPIGWAFCNGQILSIAQNTALFALLGTTYGGDGRSTFALPDFQGRAPMQQGQGPGLTNYILGEQSGSATVTLLEAEIPNHQHQASGSGSDPVTISPTNASWAGSEFGDSLRSPSDGAFGVNALAVAGASQPHNNMQPYLSLNFVIALQGVFPPRS